MNTLSAWWRLVITSALVLAGLVSPSGWCEDRMVRISGTLSGILHAPATDATPDRAVLILHGWNDDADGVGDLQAALARALGARGIASLRFDFTGEGERTGYVVTSTHGSRVAEASAAHAFLAEALPDARLGVLGWSLGGLTAMTIAGGHPDWFASMVLWSAAQAMRLDGAPAFNAAVREAMRTGRASYEDWTRITLTRAFLESYVGVDASEVLPRFPGSFLSIRGDEDYLPAHERRWLAMLPTDDKAALIVGGADHIFDVLEPGSTHGARVVEATAAWFDRTLTSAP